MLRMKVTALIPYIGFDISSLDETISAMQESASKLPEGNPQRAQFESAVKVMQENRDGLLKNSQRLSAHVTFLEDDDSAHGTAVFLAERGKLEEGAIYNLKWTREKA